MSGKNWLRAGCVSIFAMIAAQGHAANLLTNGSFEQPDVASYVFLNPGSSFITGWTVAAQAGSAPGTQVQLTDNAAFGALGVVASDGRQFLDLTGNVGRGGGVVSDGFATIAGATYQLSFDFGGYYVAGYGSYGDVTVDLFINGSLVQSFANPMGLSAPGSDYDRATWTFTGTGSAMTIGLFSSLLGTSSNLGVSLDNVSVEAVSSAVPEPASWAMMLGGLGVIGAAMRRRQGAIAFA